ncbi:MAG: ATP-binding protein, partial [Caulobacterales bacterium]|nr:ATP-binding protein [Caulobacterales bacterium]
HARVARGARDSLETLIFSVIDISQMKETESLLAAAKTQAEEANRSKSTFLATMSHEIRSPMNGVLGMVSALSATDLSAKQRGLVDVIEESGEALMSLLNDILDLSKVESGAMTVETVSFDFAELVDGTATLFRPSADGKGVAFEATVEPEARGWWLGDPARVRQIITNLVSNAVKFTEEGRVTVSASATPRPDGRHQLTLTVADTGIGIRQESLERLFEPFTQADESTTRKFGGTGLGLAICRRLAALMGGTIDARSEPGRGSVFRVTLPLERTQAPARSGAAASDMPLEELADHTRLTILAVDDNARNRLVLEALFEMQNAELTFAENGREALQLWAKNVFDLILMDVCMPIMDGPAATRAIRALEIESGRGRTPIIALTGNVMAHQVASYLEAGMDLHVAKP